MLLKLKNKLIISFLQKETNIFANTTLKNSLAEKKCKTANVCSYFVSFVKNFRPSLDGKKYCNPGEKSN